MKVGLYSYVYYAVICDQAGVDLESAGKFVSFQTLLLATTSLSQWSLSVLWLSPKMVYLRSSIKNCFGYLPNFYTPLWRVSGCKDDDAAPHRRHSRSIACCHVPRVHDVHPDILRWISIRGPFAQSCAHGADCDYSCRPDFLPAKPSLHLAEAGLFNSTKADFLPRLLGPDTGMSLNWTAYRARHLAHGSRHAD